MERASITRDDVESDFGEPGERARAGAIVTRFGVEQLMGRLAGRKDA